MDMPKQNYQNKLLIKYKNKPKICDSILQISEGKIINNNNFIKLIYSGLSNKIRIFGKKFIKFNKKKCLIISNNKKNLLKLKIENKKDKKNIKIKLYILENMTNLSSMFKYCNTLIKIVDISKLKTTKVKNMENLFYGCSSLTSLSDILKWDLNNVKALKGMFYGCKKLNHLLEIVKWIIISKQDMQQNSKKNNIMDDLFFNENDVSDNKINYNNNNKLSEILSKYNGINKINNLEKFDYNNIELDSLIQNADSKFIYESEIINEREKIISEAEEKLFLKRDDAILAMIYYEWNIDKLDNWYDNIEQNRINSGIELSKETKELLKKEINESNEEHCLVCGEINNNNNILYCLNCGHKFCNECWTEYLKEKIKFPINALKVTCPQKGCTCIVYEKLYYKYLYDGNNLMKLKKIIYKNFIDRNLDIRQCPNIYCKLYIKSNKHFAREIDCLCGYSYCYECLKESHSPCSCEMIQKWNELKNHYAFTVSEEEKNNMWFMGNTKECPFCHLKIEKTKGCNYMLCNKKFGGCGNAFCYVCGIEWSKHSPNHFYCNRYNEEAKKKEEYNNNLKEVLKEEILNKEKLKNDKNERFNFYYSRCFNLKNSIDICKIKLKKKDEFLENIQLIGDALEAVINSKKLLKNSYIFGYFMKDTQLKKLFEYNQGILEYSTENLLSLIFNGLDNQNCQTKINTLICAVNKFRKVFMIEIENKYISDLDYKLIDQKL